MTISPLCPYFNICGGCLYQDLSLADYKAKKRRFVIFSFRDAGIDIENILHDTVMIPFGQRRRAMFAFKNGKIGFNALKSDKIVALDKCTALLQEISDFLPILKKLVLDLGGQGDIFVLKSVYGLEVKIIQKKSDLSLKKRELLSDFANHNQLVRLFFNDEPLVQQIILPYQIDSFMQPSEMGEKALIDLILQSIENESSALDLFCGMGTFTKPLLAKNINTIGYDIGADSVKMLGEKGIARDLFRNPLQSNELNMVDMVVLDPPRAGALAQVQELAVSNVKKIIMVSCNPKTAARDCKILLDSGYAITSITPVDQFIYSNHIELVIVLKKS